MSVSIGTQMKLWKKSDPEQADTSDQSHSLSSSLVLTSQRRRDASDIVSSTSEIEATARQRRADRERQHHKQIWTKAAHGGPYRKVSPASGPELQRDSMT